MEASGHSPSWEEMIPDALGLIFSRLPLEQILTVIPSVCKPWSAVVSGPCCWQEIDIAEWSRSNPEHVDRMLHLLITRSMDALQKLSVSGLTNDCIFSFIASHAKSLQSLALPRSGISNAIVEQVAEKLCKVTFLDISHCVKIGAGALEAFGKNCKSLQHLRRVMRPIELVGRSSMDDEAHAIACNMPKLKHLEISYLRITTKGFLEILSGCKQLEYLDVCGCRKVNVDDNFVKERYPNLNISGPQVVNSYDFFWDEIMDISDTLTYSDFEEIFGDFEDTSDDDSDYFGEMIDALHGFHWPPSP